MADNLTDAQKIMRDVLAGHRMSLGMTFYRDGTCKLPTCSCGETMHPNGHPRHVAVAVDEALGGLGLEYASGQIVPGEAEYTITDGSRGPSRKDAEKCLYFPRFDLIARWVSGWTPEEDS